MDTCTMVTGVTQKRSINIYIKGFQSSQGLNASLHTKITGWKENEFRYQKVNENTILHQHVFWSLFTGDTYPGNSPSSGMSSSLIVPVCEEGEPDR